MDKRDIDKKLIRVIREAQDIKIPVPHNICKNVKINPRPKKRYGCCRKKDGNFQIEISEFILKCSDDKICEVLAHEVLHTCDGCYDHGNKWKVYAKKMNLKYGYNIKRVSSKEEMGLSNENQGIPHENRARYIIKCESCGKEYPRQRYTCVMKKINAYRCSCGGRLTLIDNSDIRGDDK